MRRHDDTPPERPCPGVLPRGSRYPAAGDQDHRSPERMSSMRAPDLGSGSRLRHASQCQGAADSPGRGRSTAGRACGRVSSACRQGALRCAAPGCLGQANLGHQVHVDVQHLCCLRASHVMRAPPLHDAPRRPDPATLPPGRGVPARNRSGSRSQSLAAIAIPMARNVL
jgi:hypothetical protein